EVHDLHVWAMGTSETALTAHVVLKDQGTDASAVLHEAEHELHEHFEIRHITLQLESAAYAPLCALREGSGCC
ncbi:MAG TPA: cation transporter, partial [Polaromonas sp.]|nr:cation transporter [Polaromonas sp.]